MIGRTNSSGVMPQGTITITTNGSHDVASYSEAIVSVSGITPTGTLQISSNGVYDVASYASAEVNVTTPTTEPTVIDMLCKSVAYVNDPSGILSGNITIANFSGNPISYFSTTGTGSFYISSYAFASTPNLSLIDLTNASNIYVGAMAFWQRNFASYSYLTFKGVVRSAAYAAFMGAHLSGTLYISWNQATIQTSCFSNNNLTSIDWTITSKASYVNLTGFAGNYNLQSIYTHPTSFSSCYLQGAVFMDCGSSPVPAYWLSRIISTNTLIDQYAFRNCTAIDKLETSIVNTISTYAFTGCTGISLISLTTSSTINFGSTAFDGCTSLTKVYTPNASTVNYYYSCFGSCESLSEITWANTMFFSALCFINTGFVSFCPPSNIAITGHASYTFTFGSNIRYVSIMQLSGILAASAFAACKASFINVKNVRTLSSSCFQSCSNVTKLLFCPSSMSSLYDRCFQGCTSLSQIYFLCDNVPQARTTNLGWPTGVSIYVKESLVTSFQTATNWGGVSSQIVGLTDAEVAQAIDDYDNTPFV